MKPSDAPADWMLTANLMFDAHARSREMVVWLCDLSLEGCTIVVADAEQISGADGAAVRLNLASGATARGSVLSLDGRRAAIEFSERLPEEVIEHLGFESISKSERPVKRGIVDLQDSFGRPVLRLSRNSALSG